MKPFNSTFRNTIVIIIVLLLAVLPFSSASASTAGPYNPGVGSNVTIIGTEAWQSPSEITSSGSPYATVTLNKDYRYSNYLQATNYSFNLPTNAIITGIQVAINRMSSGSSPSIYDNVLSLVKAGVNPGESVIVGDNKASLTQWSKNNFTTVTYGSSTDLWGTTWTADEINDPGFGVALAAYRQNMGNNLRDAIVNTMRITVYFTLGIATVSIDCGSGNPQLNYGGSIICKATVSDTGYLTPTGTVGWSTSGSGTFDYISCNLVETSIGVASCEVIYSPSKVGNHLISADYSGDINFIPATNSEMVVVNPKSASVTPDNSGKIYGETDPILTGSLDGFLPGDNITAAYNRVAGETVLGGLYTITATLSPANALSNYYITYNTGNFTITPRPITVTANAKTKIVGQPDPILTYKITTGSLAFTDAFTGALTRDPGETVGTYAIRQGTLVLNSNYNLTYIGANLTITRFLFFLPFIRR